MYDLTVQPRPWQAEALAEWSRAKKGVVAAVTGAGKTTFAFLCARDFLSEFPDGKVLFVVPTAALLDQWVVALADDLNVSDTDIGQIGGGKKRGLDRRFIVCIVNSARKYSEILSAKGSVMLIVDECHRAGSSKNARALSGHFVATLGLSATPERQYDDGFETIVKPILGDIIYRYDYASAARDGIIVPFKVTNVRFSLNPEEEKEYSLLTRSIARCLQGSDEESSERLKLLLRKRSRISWNSKYRVPLAVMLAVRHKRDRTIVFHESVDKATEIYDLLRERGVHATIYHTKLGEASRRENLRLYKRGFYSCLVCCRALDEGLNVPRTSVGIIACSTSSFRQRIQRLGRVLRVSEGKESATVYTLFATKPEEERLLDEAKSLGAVAAFHWQTAEVKKSG